MLFYAVFRHADDRYVDAAEVWHQVAKRAGLLGAARRVVLGIEIQHEGLAFEVCGGQVFVAGGWQVEVRNSLAYSGHESSLSHVARGAGRRHLQGLVLRQAEQPSLEAGYLSVRGSASTIARLFQSSQFPFSKAALGRWMRASKNASWWMIERSRACGREACPAPGRTALRSRGRDIGACRPAVR